MPQRHSLPRATQPSVAVLAAQPGAEHERMGVGSQQTNGPSDTDGLWGALDPCGALRTEWAREGLAELLQGPSINNSAGKASHHQRTHRGG